ncbi:MAG: Lrp/AsnC family transcriptional regulator [Planctomycetes bacterium]|nr:Lrp/AsnC family transcriptional regulator [Planctomycetota bacterium]
MADNIDLRILGLLQRNARISNADIARELEMAPSAILERIRKLEQRGVLLGYESRIDAKSVGLGLTAFVFVSTAEPGGKKLAGLEFAKFPEAQEVHLVAGDDCYLVKLRVRDTEDLARVLSERFGPISSVRGTRSTIVLRTLKESAALPIEASPAETE